MPPIPKIDCDDLLSKRGAQLLADAINAYWLARGSGRVRAVPYELDGHKTSYGVRSNLLNGLPPTKTATTVSGFPVKSIKERKREFLG
jgi:hypothetical protein